MSRPEPPARDVFRVWRCVTMRWSDNDAYGHVNNTVYYEWFDSAVNSWLVEHGLLDIVVGDPIALVAETRCSYFSAMSFPGDVEVGLAVAELGRSSVRYRLGVFAPGSESAAAAGEFIHVAVDRTSRRPVPWPKPWRQALRAIS